MIYIPESILASILREANDRFPCETGGILLGNQVTVKLMIGPGPLARHGRTTFEPDYQFQEAEIARAYASSDPSLEYLGDWHSHPRGSSHPSGKDVRVLERIARHPAARCKEPIMCIVSGGPCWAASAWRLVGGRCLEVGVAAIPKKGGKASTKKSSLVRLVRNLLRFCS